ERRSADASGQRIAPRATKSDAKFDPGREDAARNEVLLRIPNRHAATSFVLWSRRSSWRPGIGGESRPKITGNSGCHTKSGKSRDRRRRTGASGTRLPWSEPGGPCQGRRATRQRHPLLGGAARQIPRSLLSDGYGRNALLTRC